MMEFLFTFDPEMAFLAAVLGLFTGNVILVIKKVREKRK